MFAVAESWCPHGPAVFAMYKAAFESHCGTAEVLSFPSMGWGDAEAIQLAEVIASGILKRLKRLQLHNNSIGEVGMEALAKAIALRQLPALEKITVNGNTGNQGTLRQAAADTIATTQGRRIKVKGSLRNQLDDY